MYTYLPEASPVIFTRADLQSCDDPLVLNVNDVNSLLSGIAHERKEVALRLRNAHDIGRTLAVHVRFKPRTQRLIVEASNFINADLLRHEVTLRSPNLNPPVFKRQELLFLVEEDKGLRGIEFRDLT